MSPSWGGYILPNGSFRQYDSVFLECSAMGGQAPYRWHWNFGDGAQANDSGVYTVWVTENHTYRSVGTYNVTCSGTDSLGAHGSTNMTIRVVTWPLVIANLVLAPAGSVQQGYMVSLEADAFWGYSPGYYTWSGLPPGCAVPQAPEQAARIVCAPSAAGTYNISVSVTDAVTGHVARSYAVLVVSPAFLGMPVPQAYEVLAFVVLLAVISEVLVRFAKLIRQPSRRKTFLLGWALAAAGAVLGLVGLFLPWLDVVSALAGPGSPVMWFNPADLMANTPAAHVPASMLGNTPSYPNFFRFILVPQIVGALIFAAGCLLGLVRRMQAGFVMLLGLAVAALAIPGSEGSFWVLGVGWYLGLLAAFVSCAGFYVWRPPAPGWPPVTTVPRTPAPPVRAEPPEEPHDEGVPPASPPGP